MIVLYGLIGLLVLVAAANLLLGRLPKPPADGGGVIETAQGPIHYVETVGEGTAIVFIHGMPSTCREFDAVRAWLPGRHTVAFDRPGYAWSNGGPADFGGQLDAVVEAAGTLGIERAIVVGHSFGGGVALLLALRADPRLKGRISKLVLLDTIAYPQNLPVFFRLLDVPVVSQLGFSMVPPEVQTISPGCAPTSAATCARAPSTASRATRP